MSKTCGHLLVSTFDLRALIIRPTLEGQLTDYLMITISSINASMRVESSFTAQFLPLRMLDVNQPLGEL
jgi:hypothetical protein